MNYLKALILVTMTFVFYACPQKHEDQTGLFFIDNQSSETLIVEAFDIDNATIDLLENKILTGEKNKIFTGINSNGIAPVFSTFFGTLIVRTETDTLYSSVKDNDWIVTNITNVSRDLTLVIE